jgi:GDPmannose 4,6-dehydratase
MSNASKNRSALIVGISGQDGSYLADFLLKKGYEVHGTSRDAYLTNFSGLKSLGIEQEVHLHTMSSKDFRSAISMLTKIEPDEVYNLASQSSPALSFEQPVETFESNTVGTLNLLEAIRMCQFPCKFYNAASSEIFGPTDAPANEDAILHPSSPYAISKASAYWNVRLYREAYNMFSCSGILFNHESPLRPNRFVTSKIIEGVCEIAKGKKDKLTLGNLEVFRDWGWAPEYVEAMWSIMQQEKAEDFVIATGKAYSLKQFLQFAFESVDLDWEKYVYSDPKFFRPSDPKIIVGDPGKAEKKLGWKAKMTTPEIVKSLVQAKLNSAN